jgi:hypothetical protein
MGGSVFRRHEITLKTKTDRLGFGLRTSRQHRIVVSPIPIRSGQDITLGRFRL